MTGEEFLTLAVHLAHAAGEANHRTSVSRSYYAAFHITRELLEDMGLVLPPGPEAHQKVRLCLRECGQQEGIDAARQLESLRTERNRADYDLRDARFSTNRNALLQIEIAREIVRSLSACRQEPVLPQFRAGVRTYASQVLRLPLNP